WTRRRPTSGFVDTPADMTCASATWLEPSSPAKLFSASGEAHRIAPTPGQRGWCQHPPEVAGQQARRGPAAGRPWVSDHDTRRRTAAEPRSSAMTTTTAADASAVPQPRPAAGTGAPTAAVRAVALRKTYGHSDNAV